MTDAATGATITVLGGGPAGLAAGFYARRRGLEVRLLEAADAVGGNARTLQFGPFRYDTGAHRFHDKDARVTADVQALLGADLRRVTAPSQILWRGRRIDFPLAPGDLLRKLPPGLLARAAVEQLPVLLRQVRAPSPPRHFEEMARRRYGPTLARAFLLGYTRKLWGRPPRRLAPDVAGSRLEGLDLRALLAEAFSGALGTRKGQARHLDGAFLYPRHGYGQIAEATAGALGRGRIRTGARVTQIEHDGARIRRVKVNGAETQSVEAAISTLPLTRVLALLEPAPPADVRQAARSMRFRHVRLAVLGLPERPRVTPNASLYFASPRVPFTRLYEPKNRSAQMAPPGQTAVVLELPCDPGSRPWRMSMPALRRLARQTLAAYDLVGAGEPAAFTSHAVPFAYPVLEVGTAQTARRLRAYLARFENLHLLGRSARFSYTHVHDLYAQARKLAHHLAG